MRSHQRGSGPAGYWPQVVLATVAVVLLPLLIISALEASGRLESPIASIFLAILSSVAVASAGSAYWTRRGGSKDIVFGDLMVWSWLRRMRTERQLTQARRALGLDRRGRTAPAELSPERQAEVLEQLASSLEARDLYTHGHSRRVTRHSHMIARQMGLPREQVEKVRAAAAMHDVGKLNVPRAVLNKPGKLSDEEFEVIKRHPGDGAEMVANVGDPETTAMVRHHHERIDGTGYPDGLPGDQIPLGARIIAVADTFDAITSSRPYRPARQHKKAIAVLKEEAGRQLDAGAVDAFLGYYSGRRAIAWWALVTTAFQRLVASLAGPIESASASSITQGAVAVAASAALGTSLVGPATQPDRHSERNVGHTRSSQVIEAASFKARPSSDENAHRTSRLSGMDDRHEIAAGPEGDATPARPESPAPSAREGSADEAESQPTESAPEASSPREDSASDDAPESVKEPDQGERKRNRRDPLPVDEPSEGEGDDDDGSSGHDEDSGDDSNSGPGGSDSDSSGSDSESDHESDDE